MAHMTSQYKKEAIIGVLFTCAFHSFIVLFTNNETKSLSAVIVLFCIYTEAEPTGDWPVYITHYMSAGFVCMFVYMLACASTHRSICSWLARWVTNRVMCIVGTGIMALANRGSCWSTASWTSVTAELICHWTHLLSIVSSYKEADFVTYDNYSFPLCSSLIQLV